MAADTHLHSLFGRAVQPHSFDRLSQNPGVLLHDGQRERVRGVRLAGELISPFDAPDDDGAISAAQECWLQTAIAIALAAKQHAELPSSSWIYADGRIVPAQFDASWLALRKRALLTVAVEIKYAAAEVGAWLAQFGNEDGMVAHLERVIWPDGVPRCHRCGNQRVVRTPREPRRLWCGACRLEFTAAQSTVIGSSHWPLPCWFASAYLHLADGLTTLNLARACNLNPQATWDILVGKRGAAGKLTAEQWDRLADVIVLGRTPPNPTGAVAEPVGTRPTFGRNSGRALGKQAERRKVIKLGRGEFERPKAAAPAFTLFEPPPPPPVEGIGKRGTHSAEELRRISEEGTGHQGGEACRGDLCEPRGAAEAAARGGGLSRAPPCGMVKPSLGRSVFANSTRDRSSS